MNSLYLIGLFVSCTDVDGEKGVNSLYSEKDMRVWRAVTVYIASGHVVCSGMKCIMYSGVFYYQVFIMERGVRDFPTVLKSVLACIEVDSAEERSVE